MDGRRIQMKVESEQAPPSPKEQKSPEATEKKGSVFALLARECTRGRNFRQNEQKKMVWKDVGRLGRVDSWATRWRIT